MGCKPSDKTAGGRVEPGCADTLGRDFQDITNGSDKMKTRQALLLGVALAAMAGFVAFQPAQLSAQNTVTIDADDIGGVVTGPRGPEAGVWVIAETHDLGTRMSKMVVTDDQGRYVIPDLPKAKYK